MDKHKGMALHRARLIRPKRWWVGSDSRSEPEQRRRDRPIALIVAIKSSAKPPRVSATRGMQSRPLERQLGGSQQACAELQLEERDLGRMQLQIR